MDNVVCILDMIVREFMDSLGWDWKRSLWMV